MKYIMLIRMQTIKAMLTRSKYFIRNYLLVISLYILRMYLSRFCSCPQTYEAELKTEGLVNLIYEISRQHRIQTVVWVFLDDFS
jgi:hypothetical protein